jgi:FKBP-type peptidyl-prolyl cis-trans isomerase (trigger factor)
MAQEPSTKDADDWAAAFDRQRTDDGAEPSPRVDLFSLSDRAALPEVAPPQLEGLTLEVHAPPAPTRDALLARLEAKLRAAGSRRDRAPGEQVGPGDDVQVDLTLYHQGGLVAAGIQVGLSLLPGPHSELQGLREAVDGRRVASTFDAPVLGAAGAKVAQWRGLPLLAAIHLRGACEVSPLCLDDSDALARLGLGGTPDEVMDALAAELAQEREAAVALRLQTAALQALAGQVSAALPARLVDEELTRQWLSEQGAQLQELGFSAEERQEAICALLAAPSARVAAEERLKGSAALAALLRTGAVQLTRDGVTRLVQALAVSAGLSEEGMRALLRADARLNAQAEQLALYTAALDHVLARAEVNVVEPD